MLRIKSGVGAARIWGLQPCMVIAAIICRDVMDKHGFDATITAGIDGKHMAGSKHYVGLALDLRTNVLLPSQVETVRVELKDALGDDYDVVVEGDHLHLECQPKIPYTA